MKTVVGVENEYKKKKNNNRSLCDMILGLSMGKIEAFFFQSNRRVRASYHTNSTRLKKL